MTKWQLQEAKARLSDLVRQAQEEGPQAITVRGEPRVVVPSHEEYQRLARPKPSFLEFIRSSPLVGPDLKLARSRSPVRNVKL
jgi:prevent-host-death family protein